VAPAEMVSKVCRTPWNVQHLWCWARQLDVAVASNSTAEKRNR